ncbi:aspartate ammonia-lyase [Sutterella sp.]|uniref:aspartate ammonia-lyase n=1 Tax=Sutterella sp. TaxID=1981025 RepID=UPI0025F8C99A|nr:aspartate ammonia-lyase [uncultured Sutterella sp.]
MSRIESDFLGSLEIPDEDYYGVQTMRGKQNFHITEMPMSQEPFFAQAFGYVKKAAAMANKELGTIPADVADGLIWAAEQLIAGKYNDQFVTDWLQGGAGTSTNMNCNEVISNLACEHLGLAKGDKKVSPNDHANFGQSTNDTYPTALHLSLLMRSNVLIKAVEELVQSFYAQAEKNKNVLKMGRTHLQDAVPMSFGQEFHGWGKTLEDEIEVIRDAQKHLKIVNLGATAIGTSVTAHPDYPALAVKNLAKITGIDFKNSDDLIAATSDCGAYVALSSACKSLSVKLTKVCNDLRLLASGPRTGLSEIVLPQLQPGSSIMPGKVNPVIPEVTNQASFLAIGLDTTVMLAASAGQLELNVMEPVISFALYMQMKVLTNACIAMREKCVDGIVVNAKHCEDLVMGSLGIVTVLKPHFGYKPCAACAREGFLTGKSLHQIVVEEKKMLTEEEWGKIFTYDNLINPKFEQ